MLWRRLLLLLARERPRDPHHHRLGGLGGQTDRGGCPGTGSLEVEEVSIVNILTILIIISLTWTGGAVLEAVLTEVVLDV